MMIPCLCFLRMALTYIVPVRYCMNRGSANGAPAGGAFLADIPEDWEPRAKQQPTGLIACGAARRRPVRAHWTPHQIKKSAVAMQQRIFWWGAQWDSNPRSPDPQSGALTDYAMGTTSMRPKGLEPPAHCLEGSCSIHLSYGRTLLSHWVLIWFAAVSRSTLREV